MKANKRSHRLLPNDLSSRKPQAYPGAYAAAGPRRRSPVSCWQPARLLRCCALARLGVVPGGAGWATGWARAVGGADRKFLMLTEFVVNVSGLP